METKLDSRQGQFPASFPDTFKDFFAMMSEDEDHLDLFSNLLEDKVIPRASRHNQRRCGGSLRCPSTSTTNVGRSNSFRVNRPVNNYCKHIKYCCLHQKQYSQNFIDFGYSRSGAKDDHNSVQNLKGSRSSLMERTFECESCEESDAMSTSSSTATIPYNNISRHQAKGFQSKESLPRIVQQCGLRESTSGIVGGPSNSMGAAVSSGNISANPSATGRPTATQSATSMSSTQVTMTKCFSDKLNCCTRPSSIRPQKSPILNRRRSSSIAATLLASDSKIFRNGEDLSPVWAHSIPQSNTREILSHAKSPVNCGTAGIHSTVKGKISVAESGVLSFKQAMSGAVSPQITPTSTSFKGLADSNNTGLVAPQTATNGGVISPSSVTTTTTVEGFFGGSVAAISQMGPKTKQRMRTSSMPGESRKPRLADTRRAAIHCADMDIEYYRLRSFSITSHGICNLGDSLRSRRSRSINSVTSTGTSNSGRDRNNSNASRTSGDIMMDHELSDKCAGEKGSGSTSIPAYKIAMLGSSGVGKTALTYQFTTSDYICAYDLSLDDDYGQKTVSVLLDGMETDLEVIDHPACEMSTEAFCSTYNIDLFVVVYSVVDRNSFKAAEKVLHYLKESEMLLTRGAILVGNKTDLERHREVTTHNGRKLAKEIACKFIETSSGLDHNVDELLVGIVAQVKLNPQRLNNLNERQKQRLRLNATMQPQHRRVNFPPKKVVKQLSICEDTDIPGKSGPIKKTAKRVLNLENILKVGESEVDDDDDDGYRPDYHRREVKKKSSEASCSSSPKSRNSYENPDLSQNNLNLVEDNKKTISKLSNRTKIFLSSVLRFKKNLNVKRRNSSSCSDLFVI